MELSYNHALNFIRFRLIVTAVICLLAAFAVSIGIFSPPVLYFSLGILLYALIGGLAILLVISRQAELMPLIMLISYFIDITVSCFTLYFSGGLANNWWFLLAVPIFALGYEFNLYIAIFYAALTSIIFLSFSFLEYFRLIPHFSPYAISAVYWHEKSYFINFIMSTPLLYFVAAAAGGIFNRTKAESLARLKKLLSISVASQNEAKTAQRSLINVMEDLTKARNELEERVHERTAALEEAKLNLENRVTERTVELERARKAAMHMLKDLREDMIKLQNVDRLKTEFLSMVSHELRTPLTPIKGYISLLASEKLGQMPASQKEALQILNRQSDSLADLVESLLDISRLELGKPIPIKREPVSVKKLVEEIIESIKIMAESHGLSIDVQIADDLPTILVDAIKIRRVLTNLIGNAIKFTPSGGKIFVRVRADGPGVHFEVEDNGIGVAPEFLEKIFQKFFQIENSFTAAAGGIGMGLAISKELVELHGGKIWAESAGLGKGTKISFILPLAEGGKT